MEKLKIFKRNLNTLLATFVLISQCGCSSNNEKNSVEKNNIKTPSGNYIEYNYDNYLDSIGPFTEESTYEKQSHTEYYEEQKDVTTPSVTITPPIFTTTIETVTTTSIFKEDLNNSISTEDKTINDYFTKAKEEIKKLLESKEYETAKLKAKEFIKTGVDFIFYGKSINGITFNDITEESKKVT